MLVATPGQTTSYVLHAKKSCHTTNNNSSASGSNASPTNNGNSTTKTARHVLANCVKSAAAAVINTKQVTHNLAPPSVEHTGHQTTTNIHTNNLSSIKSSTNSTATTNSNTSTNALMKTLSVRLNRGTEFLKETVQKAFITKIPSHINSVLNLYTVPPTSTHRYPAERLNVSSADSLHTEMCHFKPIRTEPRTPWKSNSKSRGASLKTPKACQATKVKLNCDGSADDEHLQFKPKPSSTLLTTIVTTPTHQSAFVCLIAQMKTFANIHQSTQSNMELHKTKSNKFKTKSKSTLPVTKSAIDVPLNELILRKRRTTPFVNVKKINLAAELIGTKKREPINTSITKAKSKVALSKSKSKLKNNLDNNNTSSSSKSQVIRRKRKLYTCEVTDAIVGGPKIRKSSRKIKDCSREITKITSRKSFTRLTKRQPLMQSKRATECFSPPLTRSRLKQMSSANLQLIPALEHKKRGGAS